MDKQTSTQSDLYGSNTSETECSKCKNSKPQSEFGVGRRICRTCRAAYTRAWNKANPAKARELRRAWYKANRDKCLADIRQWRRDNPEKVKAIKRKWDQSNKQRSEARRKKRVYGITEEQFKAMADAQQCRCAICGETDARGLKIDHCHNSSKIRGLLCNNCNAGIGMFRDDPARLRSAIEYLSSRANGGNVA